MKRTLVSGALLLLLAGCGRTTSEWIDQLHAGDSSQRLHAVHALEERRGDTKEVVAALTTALKDEDAFVRRDAAKALGKLGPDAADAAPALAAAALKDHNTHVRKAAADALKQIDPAAAKKAGVK
jgi:HEAT repeat protein